MPRCYDHWKSLNLAFGIHSVLCHDWAWGYCPSHFLPLPIWLTTTIQDSIRSFVCPVELTFSIIDPCYRGTSCFPSIACMLSLFRIIISFPGSLSCSWHIIEGLVSWLDGTLSEGCDRFLTFLNCHVQHKCNGPQHERRKFSEWRWNIVYTLCDGHPTNTIDIFTCNR